MDASENRDPLVENVKELLLVTGAQSSFMMHNQQVIYLDEGVDDKIISLTADYRSQLFAQGASPTGEVLMKGDSIYVLLSRDQEKLLGLLYAEEPENIAELGIISRQFIRAFQRMYQRYDEEQKESEWTLKLADNNNENLPRFFKPAMEITIPVETSEGLQRGIPAQFHDWYEFKPHLISLLSKVMNEEQSQRLLLRILKRNGLEYGPRSSEIGHLAREVILEIPHRKKRKSLLSELHDILVHAGIENKEANVVQFFS